MNMDHATPELLGALALAQGEVENATKNAANPHFRSKYADLAEVLNTVRPVFAKHGICIIQAGAFDGEMVNVTTTLAHKSGGWIASTFSCVPSKTDAQGIGSAATYCRRYSLAGMTGVAQEDDDGNSVAHEQKPAPVVKRIDQKQQAAVLDMIESAGADKAKFLAWAKVASVEDIRVDQYERIVKALEAKSHKEAA